MDNLIRTKRGYPILHLDYSRMTGTITQNANAMAGGSQTAAAIISNVVNWGVGGSQQQVLTVTADPVININEVYNAYLQFIDEGKLAVTCDEPACGDAHICRKCGEYYYWIPNAYAADFLRLHLVTSVQRGQPLSVPKNFKSQIVTTVGDPVQIDQTPIYQLVIRLDEQKKVPNDGGFLKVSLKGIQREIDVAYYKSQMPGDEAVDYGKPTDRLIVYVNTMDIGLTAKEIAAELSGKEIDLFLDNHRPTVKSTQDLIESIRDDLHLIRIQQQSL